MFLTLETSPGNFKLARAGRQRGQGICPPRTPRHRSRPTASGATRVAGSLNFKDKYAPDFPRVTIRGARRPHDERRRARTAGACRPPKNSRRCLPPARYPGSNRKWPSYALALDGAPLNSEAGPDRSRADFVWCMTAITWGFGVDATAERLIEESSKARAMARAMPNSPPVMRRSPSNAASSSRDGTARMTR